MGAGTQAPVVGQKGRCTSLRKAADKFRRGLLVSNRPFDSDDPIIQRQRDCYNFATRMDGATFDLACVAGITYG
ncbi:hypothetical protein SAMN05660463_00915 [Pseudomonas sp. URIL14HWK12:I9]|nr:hypothetical protein F474_00489 [Pseudomonas sp. URIL14HWK12:I12]PVZ26964.1 hypothetical protein F470_00144 [Pseudomonas sp. URIL14HWK12:I10]PVZ37853.1 hypothetical protein F472_00489 [Pseudomonas sp. URIL14HWK12:I11]SNZ05405.1 hypothetical protein SAMN05660463_00915 [Pseudomonas sp. URIL14HWK12:I9]